MRLARLLLSLRTEIGGSFILSSLLAFTTPLALRPFGTVPRFWHPNLSERGFRRGLFAETGFLVKTVLVLVDDAQEPIF